MPGWLNLFIYVMAGYGFIMLFYPLYYKKQREVQSLDKKKEEYRIPSAETAAALEEFAGVSVSNAGKEKIHITILDDDEIIPLFLEGQLKETILGQLGTELEWFREPEAFLQSGRLDQPGKHILILDGMLPRMDGLEVLQWVNTRYSHQRVEVIMVSGRTKEADIVSAFQLGAFDYIGKPFKIHELVARLSRTIQRMM